MNAPYDRDQSMQVMRYDAERIVDEVIQQKMDRTIYQLISKRVNELREEVMDYVDGRWSDAQKPSGEMRYFGGSLIHNRQDSSSIDFLQSGTGAIAQTLQAWARARAVNLVDYLPAGYVTDGSVDYTTQIGNWLTACAGRCGIAPAGTFLFTTITVSADTVIVGAGRNATKFNTATTGSAVTLNGHRIHFADLWINQSSGTKQGKGIVGDDKYWFATSRVDVTGFDYDTYLSKSLYHTHNDSHFEGGNHGLYYWGNSGVWNVDWYNNQIELNNVRSFGTTIGCYIKGVGIKIPLIDVSSSGIGLQIQGESASYSAVGIEIDDIYSELTNTVLQMQYAYVRLGSGFVQGGVSSGARAPTPFNLDNSELIVTGKVKGFDFWTNRYVLTNSSRLENIGNQLLGFGADFSGTSVDATSKSLQSDYDEGSCTLTLTGCTTAPTVTASWVRNGKIVVLLIPDISATSNSTSATLTGLDSTISPVSDQWTYINVLDSGANFMGTCKVGAGTTVIALQKGAPNSNFTNSGVKGISQSTISYNLF